MFGGCRCCFKGGGAIRGPQSSGLVLGKESWVAACRDNAFPNRAVRLPIIGNRISAAFSKDPRQELLRGQVGRPMKVCKEEIVGLAAAVVRTTATTQTADHAALRVHHANGAVHVAGGLHGRGRGREAGPAG